MWEIFTSQNVCDVLVPLVCPKAATLVVIGRQGNMEGQQMLWAQTAQVGVLPLPRTNHDFGKVIQLLFGSMSLLVKWK